MRRSHVLPLAVAAILSTVSSAHALEWACGFNDFTGSDGSAVASYTDVNGNNPRSYAVWTASSNWANVPAGWLTQGDIGGGNKTAKFYNGPGNGGGRARFGTALPTSMDADGGVTVAWRMRLGAANPGRGPFQICLTSDGQTYNTGSTDNNKTVSAFFLVRNSGGPGGMTTIDIQRNGGGLYSAVTPDSNKVLQLVLTQNLTDQWHQWTAAVIRDPATQRGYWKLWLDGTLLLFPGGAGSPTYDPDGAGPEPSQQFSFFTALAEGFDGTVHNEPYIGLGELASATYDQWDFEFDCVSYRDDTLSPFTCGSSVPACDASVVPGTAQLLTAIRGGPAPAPVVYTFANAGSVATGYTVATSDASGNTVPASTYPWLSLDKAGNPSVDPLGGNDSVTVTVTDTNLAANVYTAYITFKTTCTPIVTQIRRIDLAITDCALSVAPVAEVSRSIAAGSVAPLADASLVVTNTGSAGLTYSVQKEGVDSAWLTLNKTSGGPLGLGESDPVPVTMSFNPAGLTAGTHTCSLRFSVTTGGCTNTPTDVVVRVTLVVLGPGDAREQFGAEFTAFTGSDVTAVSPVASCDPNIATARDFHFQPPGQVDQLDAGWLTQGMIGGQPATAKFYNPVGPASGGLTGVGRARFRTFLPFGSTYDPEKGMAVAWRMRISDYSPVRGPIQITVPRVTGPFGTDESNSAVSGDVFNCFVRIQNGRFVSILNNGGGQLGNISTYTLPVSIAGDTENDYHQWTAAACYQASDQMAYWNLWIDGYKLLFSGPDGSPNGPGGATFSFRTNLDNVTGDPYVGLGELQSSVDVWNFEFDWVRMLSYGVSGCPFWDGEGCVPAPLCNTPAVDADGDHDVDMDDFAVFQACYTGSGTFTLTTECGCFDRNRDSDVDTLDFQQFQACATGPAVVWTSTPGCP